MIKLLTDSYYCPFSFRLNALTYTYPKTASELSNVGCHGKLTPNR